MQSNGLCHAWVTKLNECRVMEWVMSGLLSGINEESWIVSRPGLRS